jgi:hypothetical protein
MRGLRVWPAVAAAVVFVQCGGKQSGSSDTNTNWLEHCDDSADCSGSLQCIAHVCTRLCSARRDCTGFAAQALCTSAMTQDAKACTLPCTSVSECPGAGDTWSCEQEACVPAVASAGSSPTEGGAGGAVGSGTGGATSMGGTRATGGNSGSGGAQTTGGRSSPTGGSEEQAGAGPMGLPGGAGGSAGGGGELGGSGAGGLGLGSAGTAVADVQAACTERGGSCVAVDNTDSACPDGTYDPFSGDRAFCRTDPAERCCVPKGGIGSPCDDDHLCDASPETCLSGPSTNPPDGVCTGYCDNNSPCPAGAVCAQVLWSQAPGMCLAPCTSDSECREGWSCQPHRIPLAIAADYASANACWAGDGSGLRLGEACTQDVECISDLCLALSAAWAVCSVPCDDKKPCLPGFECLTDIDVDCPTCGYCSTAQYGE